MWGLYNPWTESHLRPLYAILQQTSRDDTRKYSSQVAAQSNMKVVCTYAHMYEYIIYSHIYSSYLVPLSVNLHV
jgi:hypothetical protein